MSAGWVCRVLSDAGAIELEQLDDAGRDWFASGPSGEGMGRLEPALRAAAGSFDAEWLARVVSTIERDRASQQRSMLLVRRVTGTWFHTTLAENRESICRFGLDWKLMTGSGIAGSRAPETDGVFLCSDLEGAEWFAQMGRRRGGIVDIWAVRLDGAWLVSDPGASGGGGDWWMISPEPVPAQRLRLVRTDLGPGGQSSSVTRSPRR